MWHFIVDAHLNREHWHRLIALILREVTAPARMALGKSADGQYVVALLHPKVVAAHSLIDIHAGPSFEDFCTGAATRMKGEGVPFDLVRLGDVLGQRRSRG